MTIKEKLICELKSGRHYGIFIDDTGSPGLVTTTALNPNRKTWVAVIIPPGYMPEIMNQMPQGISELRNLTGATEFHFAKIYSGSKQFKNIPVEVRDGIIRFMGFIFDRYDLRVYNQTFDPTHVEQLRQDIAKNDLRPHFKLDNHEHLSLLFLLSKLKKFMIDHTSGPSQTAIVIIDEGMKKSGTCMNIPGLCDRFLGNRICFADSKDILPIQLADFAAWWFNRMQIISSHKNPSQREMALLEALSHMSTRYSNARIEPMNPDVDTA